MATKSFSLGQINITDYIIVRARKVSDPGAEVERQVFGPNPPTTQNFTFVNLDNELYFFDVYESSNGTALETLFNIFEIDVATGAIIFEWKFYTVGGGQPEDPAANDTVLTDPYLNGKNVAAFFQRGLGPLKPTDEWTRTSTGMQLEAGLFFNQDDVYTAQITYPQAGSSTGNTNKFLGQEKAITANTTLDSTYYDCLINLNAAGTRLVVTLDHVATVPDGTIFAFIDQMGGSQRQAKIVPQIGESILWMGMNMPEFWCGKGEKVWLKKSGGVYKVIDDSDGGRNVGRRFSGKTNVYPNAQAEDNTLFSADDLPRYWWWLINKNNNAYYLVDDTLDNVGYVHPQPRIGQPVVSLTKRLFRMANTQNISERGGLDFNHNGGDATRSWDAPGGYQPPALLPHAHVMHGGGTISGPAGNLYLNRTGTGPQPKRYSGGGTGDNLGGGTAPDATMITGQTGGPDNIVANFSVVYCTCI